MRPRPAAIAALVALGLNDALPAPPLEVELAGCTSVRAEGARLVCEVPAQPRLHLWVPLASDRGLEVRYDGRPQAISGVPLQDGMAFDLSLPAEVRRLSVASGDGARFDLQLQPDERVPALEEAEKRRQAGKYQEAEALLAPLLEDPRPAVRARATGKLARVARWQGRTDQAVALLRQAIALDRRAGLLQETVFDAFVLSVTLRDKGRHYAEARAALDDVAPEVARFPQGRAMEPHYRALLSFAVGDLREALRLFDDSDRRAARLGLDAHRVDVLEQKADALSTLGRHGEARALVDQAGALVPPRPCAQAQWENDAGWISIVAREAEGAASSAPEPTAPLRRALELYRTTCPDPVEACRVLVNLAHEDLLEGRTADAARDLEASRAAAPHPGSRLEAWWLILGARVALAEGRPQEALDASRELGLLADREVLPDAHIEALADEAQALDALNRAGEARVAWKKAEERLAAWSVLAPLGGGRDGFVASHQAVTRRRVEFLLRRGEQQADPSSWYAEAAAAARLARARALASLGLVDRVGALPAAQRAEWEEALGSYRRGSDELREKAVQARDLPRDQLLAFAARQAAAQAKLDADFERALSRVAASAGVLPALAPGALLLVPYPLERGWRPGRTTVSPSQEVGRSDGEREWVVFAVSDQATTTRRVGALNPASLERLSAQLLGPFRAELEAAHEVRFAPYGPLLRVDAQALPWRGKSLLDFRPVLYPLDLAVVPRRPQPTSGAPLALIVSDPRGDLPAARREARGVAAALSARGWRTWLLEGQDATLQAVRRAMEAEDTKLLHFAGHGTAAGWDGWESRLSLADGELRVPDVLALRRVPDAVVLSACDSAAPNDRVPVETLGVGQAFVLVGASAVVAAVRPVDDRLSERLMSRLYEASGEPLSLDLAAALRATQLAEAGRDAPGDWASFRVIGP